MDDRQKNKKLSSDIIYNVSYGRVIRAAQFGQQHRTLNVSSFRTFVAMDSVFESQYLHFFEYRDRSKPLSPGRHKPAD